MSDLQQNLDEHAHDQDRVFDKQRFLLILGLISTLVSVCLVFFLSRELYSKYNELDWLVKELEKGKEERNQQMHTAGIIDEMNREKEYLEAKLNSSEREIQELKQTLDGKGSDISRLESDAKKMKVELDSKDKELHSRKREIQVLRHTLDRKGSDISMLESDAKKMEVELDSKDKELDSPKREIQELRHTLDGKRSDISRLESDAKMMQVELDSKNKELDSCMRKIQELKHILDKKRSDISRLESDAKKMQLELDSKNNELSSCQSSKESVYTEANNCRKDLMYSQEKTKKMEEELKEQKMTSKENEDRFLKYFQLYNEEQKSHSECKYTGRTTYEELKKEQSEELNSRKREIEELRNILDGKRSDISRLESDAKKMQVELDSKNKELSSCQSSKESVYTEAKDCGKDLMYSQEKTKKMEEELKEQKMTSEEYEDRFLKYFYLYNEEQKSHSECKYTGHTSYKVLKKKQSEELDSCKREIQELRNILNGKRSDISRLESDAKKMQVELDSENKELSSCQSSKESVYTEAKDCRKDLMYSHEKTIKMEEELKEQKMTGKENALDALLKRSRRKHSLR